MRGFSDKKETITFLRRNPRFSFVMEQADILAPCCAAMNGGAAAGNNASALVWRNSGGHLLFAASGWNLRIGSRLMQTRADDNHPTRRN